MDDNIKQWTIRITVDNNNNTMDNNNNTMDNNNGQ